MNNTTKTAVVLSIAALGISVMTYFYIQSEAEKAKKEAAQAEAKTSGKALPSISTPIVSEPAVGANPGGGGDVCDKVRS